MKQRIGTFVNSTERLNRFRKPVLVSESDPRTVRPDVLDTVPDVSNKDMLNAIVTFRVKDYNKEIQRLRRKDLSITIGDNKIIYTADKQYEDWMKRYDELIHKLDRANKKARANAQAQDCVAA